MKHKQILLVDDSLLTSKIISDFLTENGYEVFFVATGEAALEIVCSSQFDLILMDIELAGNMNGIDSAHEILKYIDVPIIFLTAHASKEILYKVKEVNAYGFVQKGIDKYALLSTIEMTLNLYNVNVKTKLFNEELQQANKKLEDSRKQYFELTENAPVGIVKCNNDGDIIFVNQSALEILGSPSSEETKKINLLTNPALIQYGLSEQLKKCLNDNEFGVYEMNYKTIWGKSVYMRLHIKLLTDQNKVIGAQIIIDDVTEKKLLEEELRLMSLTDPLTKAYNRRYFIEKLAQEIDRVQRQSSGAFCIAMLDIDHFKQINDSFGHSIGDLLLINLVETIKDRIRKIDCLARWGGEEFILLLPETNIQQATYITEELRILINDIDYRIDHKITASFGVIEYCPGDTIDSLIQKADNLMYEAKASGRNCVHS